MRAQFLLKILFMAILLKSAFGQNGFDLFGIDPKGIVKDVTSIFGGKDTSSTTKPTLATTAMPSSETTAKSTLATTSMPSSETTAKTTLATTSMPSSETTAKSTLETTAKVNQGKNSTNTVANQSDQSFFEVFLSIIAKVFQSMGTFSRDTFGRK